MIFYLSNNANRCQGAATLWLHFDVVNSHFSLHLQFPLPQCTHTQILEWQHTESLGYATVPTVCVILAQNGMDRCIINRLCLCLILAFWDAKCVRELIDLTFNSGFAINQQVTLPYSHSFSSSYLS